MTKNTRASKNYNVYRRRLRTGTFADMNRRRCQVIRDSVCPSVRLSACLSVCLSVCPSVRRSIHSSFHPSVQLSVCVSVCLSVSLSVCLSFCLSVCLSVCLTHHVRICCPMSMINCTQRTSPMEYCYAFQHIHGWDCADFSSMNGFSLVHAQKSYIDVAKSAEVSMYVSSSL